MEDTADAASITGIEEGTDSGGMDSLRILLAAVLEDSRAIHDPIYVLENR
jgi:hypothetical protein